ncbi:NAD(P)-dependent oxidoreductase [Blastopirellula sp. JC732]|uniref:NAD(P)-dependent oxidoreductase n=1 Tax=Blastopirellula sediminis TaxID=2894196 RepID=A0A9X1MNN3_9BACT|nr:NAD(P)-dependent oxidoreductase [Blastopirellula sediminis]MCC9606709.1 NAD(P)-dependent oxidoreductase [Blastopirellula sediminis]MCC9629994.1 NAD(P)-dependent oxidoreductase [Blastopirellula sediminis]
MRALITGAAGFGGYHLVEHSLASGDEVMGIVRGSTNSLMGNAAIAHWDIREPIGGEAEDAIRQFEPEAIYHLAAISRPSLCGSDFPNDEAVHTNVDGTRRILDLAASLDTKPKVILVSSSHVYGIADQKNPVVSETTTPLPNRGYGRSKLAAEQAALTQTDVPVVIARAFNHTGPGQTPNYIVPEWCKRVASSFESIEVESLSVSFDLSDVRDIVRGYRLLAEKGEDRKIYNIGSGNSTQTGELMEMICSLSRRRPDIHERNPQTRSETIADITLIRELGYSPAFSLQRSVADVWAEWA